MKSLAFCLKLTLIGLTIGFHAKVAQAQLNPLDASLGDPFLKLLEDSNFDKDGTAYRLEKLNASNKLSLYLYFSKQKQSWSRLEIPRELEYYNRRATMVTAAIGHIETKGEGTLNELWTQVMAEQSQDLSLKYCLENINRCDESLRRKLTWLSSQISALRVRYQESIRNKGEEAALTFLLKEVNLLVNGYTFRSDDSRDRWKTPLQFLRESGGDCEDIVIFKYVLLSRVFGVPIEKMRASWIYHSQLKGHMVLAVYAEAKVALLDNLNQDRRRLPSTLFEIQEYIDNGWILLGMGNEEKTDFVFPVKANTP